MRKRAWSGLPPGLALLGLMAGSPAGAGMPIPCSARAGDFFYASVESATPGTRSRPPEVSVAVESVVRGKPPSQMVVSPWIPVLPPRPSGLDARARERARTWDAAPIVAPERGARLLLMGVDERDGAGYRLIAACSHPADSVEAARLVGGLELHEMGIRRDETLAQARSTADRERERRADLRALFASATNVLVGERAGGGQRSKDGLMLQMGIARWIKTSDSHEPKPNEHYAVVQVDGQAARRMVDDRLHVRGLPHQKLLLFLREVPEERRRPWPEGPFRDRRSLEFVDSENGMIHATPERIAALGVAIPDLDALLRDPAPASRGAAAIPDEVRRVADAYVTSLVGESYFRENYTWLPEQSTASPFGRGTEYRVGYRYRPLVGIGADPPAYRGSPDPTTVRVYLGDLAGLKGSGFVAYLDEEGGIREPTITRELALEMIEADTGEPIEPEATRATLLVRGRAWDLDVEVHRPDPVRFDCTLVTRHRVDVITGVLRPAAGARLCDDD